MEATRILKTILLTTLLAAIYVALGTVFIGLHTPPPPESWQDLMGSSEAAVLGWLFLTHSMQVLLAALIPGLLLNLMRPKGWHWIGMAASLPFLGMGLESLLFIIRTDLASSVAHRLVMAGDMLVFLLAIPLVAWLAQRLIPGSGVHPETV